MMTMMMLMRFVCSKEDLVVDLQRKHVYCYGNDGGDGSGVTVTGVAVKEVDKDKEVTWIIATTLRGRQ